MTHVTLLLFSEKTLLFGAYADQIEELLETRHLSQDFDEKGEMTISSKTRPVRVIHFGRWLGLEKHSDVLNDRLPDPTRTTSPRILLLRCRDGSYRGIWVEHLRQLLMVPIEHIYALPVLMEHTKRIQAIWGIAIVETRPVILFDLEHVS